MVGRMSSLGPYELGAALGEGATGRVFEATDTSSGRRVALKILHADLTRTADTRQTVCRSLEPVVRRATAMPRPSP